MSGKAASPFVRFVLALLGVFALASFLAMPVVGILGSSNLVWGEPNQFGRVRIPGTSVLTRPAGGAARPRHHAPHRADRRGEYRVEVEGAGLGTPRAQLWLGHRAPLPGTDVPLVAAILGLVVTFIWAVSRIVLGRKSAPAT